MPGVRAKGQVLLNLACDVKFIAEIDAAVVKSGAAGRSQFIRDAIYDKMISLHMDLPPGIKGAPLRKPRATRAKAKS